MPALSEQLDEMLSSISGRPVTVADKAELLMLLSEAAALARRVEEAPVAHVCGECEHTWMRHIDTDTPEQDAALAAMTGRRVRIVEE